MNADEKPKPKNPRSSASISGYELSGAETIDRITDHELGRMLNYLKITMLPVGLILNFKRAKLEWKRVVLETTDGR